MHKKTHTHNACIYAHNTCIWSPTFKISYSTHHTIHMTSCSSYRSSKSRHWYISPVWQTPHIQHSHRNSSLSLSHAKNRIIEIELCTDKATQINFLFPVLNLKKK